MALFFLVHTYKPDHKPLEFWDMMAKEGPPLAKKMVDGKTSAVCLKSWNPLPYGRSDYMFCLWEADKPEDILATAGEAISPYITVDVFKVDEVDWVKMAQMAPS
ncbi:MAG: hypothetical protein ACYC6L_14145, partial [Anaerolineae bacterium]